MTVETVVPAETEPDEEKSLALKEVYEIFNSPSGKAYLTETYFDGSEMQIYEEQDYYLIGMQGAKFYSYLLYDKEKKTISDLGMQNEVIQWDEEKDIIAGRDGITFYCTGQRKQNNAPMNFPYRLYYDISNKTFSKIKEDLFYGSSVDKKWHKSYRIGSDHSDSVWTVKKLEQDPVNFSIYFERKDKLQTSEYSYPEIKVETELNGIVRLWIKNCKILPSTIEKTINPAISGIHTEEYHESNESGLLVTFQVMPNYFLYGEIKGKGYPKQLTFSIREKRTLDVQKTKYFPPSYIRITKENAKEGKESNLKVLQEVNKILELHKDEILKNQGSGESEKWFFLNQPTFYLFGVNGYYNFLDYYIYDKRTKEFKHLDISTVQADWGNVCAATVAGEGNAIIFPFSGYQRIDMCRFPSTVVYNIKLKTYMKRYDVISGDSKVYFWDNRFPYAESIWGIEKIEKSDEEVSFYFEQITEGNNIASYYPEVHFVSDVKNHVSVWIKNCNITQEQADQITIEGISNVQVEQVSIGEKSGTALSFDISPGYYLFGEVNGDFMPVVRTKYLTFYVKKSTEMQRPYDARKDL